MSQAPPDNGGSPAGLNGGDPEHRIAPPKGQTGPALHRRTGQTQDWRLRSLRTGPNGDVPAASPRTDHRHRHQRPILVTAAVFAAVAVLAVVLIQAFVTHTYDVRGDAMAPTLQGGDRILVLAPGVLPDAIDRGDIVVVHPARSLPCSVAEGTSGDLVLRVAAVPGDVISSVGDRILVDGRRLRERGWYDPRFGEIGSTPIRTTTLSAGRYFVLADNRSNACDSRTFGPITRSSVAGVGIAVVGRQGHVSFGTL